MCKIFHFDDALLANSKAWEYEQEMQLIMFDTNKITSDYVTVQGVEIESVYMGSRISDKNRSFLKNQLSVKKIPLYQMSFCLDDITKLRADRVL